MNPRRLFALSLLTLLPMLSALHAKADAVFEPTGSSPLVGVWTVDLRPTPKSAPYLRKLVITAVRGTQIEGHFYDGSPLQAGRINLTAGPQLVFAFFTDPGEGVYQSSGRQVGPDRLEGITLSTTRGFVLPWVAVRDAAPQLQPQPLPAGQ